MCDACAERPDDIPGSMRRRAKHLRALADFLESEADNTYVTEVVPVPDNWRTDHDGTPTWYSEDGFPNLMRARLGLPAIEAYETCWCRPCDRAASSS